jgi:hypothetical protein
VTEKDVTVFVPAIAIRLFVLVLSQPDGHPETDVTVRPESVLILAENPVSPSEPETFTEKVTVEPLSALDVPLIEDVAANAFTAKQGIISITASSNTTFFLTDDLIFIGYPPL